MIKGNDGRADIVKEKITFFVRHCFATLKSKRNKSQKLYPFVIITSITPFDYYFCQRVSMVN